MSVQYALPRLGWQRVLGVAALVGLSGLLVPVAPAFALATRTWVSGVGDDVNPCSRTAPCKTFGGAISKTAPSGEIDALDSGGFGAVTITKAITLDGTGAFTSVLGAGSPAITVTAGGNDVVVLRGLSVNGNGSGTSGIKFNSGKVLIVENSVISGFTSQGIDFQPGSGELVVSDVDIRNVGGSGILASGGARVTVENSRIDNADIGVNARGSSRVQVRDSVVSNNTTAGLLTDVSPAELNAVSVQVSLNGTGIQVGGVVRISDVDMFDNNVGIAVGGGTVFSFGDNRIAGNVSGNGNPPSLSPLPLQ